MYNCYNCMNQTDVRVTEYTQGTFIIDMIDPDANASVWRSVTQSKLKEETIRDQAAFDCAAMRVLAGFPPGALPASPKHDKTHWAIRSVRRSVGLNQG